MHVHALPPLPPPPPPPIVGGLSHMAMKLVPPMQTLEFAAGGLCYMVRELVVGDKQLAMSLNCNSVSGYQPPKR